MKNLITGDRETIESLDKVFSTLGSPSKDSRGYCESYTRTYCIPVDGKLVSIRLWVNGQTGRGTVKLKTLKTEINNKPELPAEQGLYNIVKISIKRRIRLWMEQLSL